MPLHQRLGFLHIVRERLTEDERIDAYRGVVAYFKKIYQDIDYIKMMKAVTKDVKYWEKAYEKTKNLITIDIVATACYNYIAKTFNEIK